MSNSIFQDMPSMCLIGPGLPRETIGVLVTGLTKALSHSLKLYGSSKYNNRIKFKTQ